MNYNFTQRVRIILSIFFVAFLIIVCRLFWIQIVKNDTYVEKSNSQYIKPVSIFDRGSIFFTSKDGVKIGAATVKNGYLLAINPKLINNPEEVYNVISEYVKIDRDYFLDKAKKTDDSYKEIQKKLDKSMGEAIINLKIPGVIIAKDAWRVYPGDRTASHTIGLTGYGEKGDIAGRYGLERYYEAILSRNNQNLQTNIFAEIFSEIKHSVFSDVNNEGDIVITIDPTVQNFLEKILNDIEKKWQSDSVGAIIMDPKTGSIYAMASLPNFNPNSLKDIKDPRIFSNPLVEEVREMGSIIKPLTMAIGIDTGAITPKTTYNDVGTLELNGKKISNFDGKARGITGMQELLSKSLNVGAATIALKTGKSEFSKYFKNLGFGKQTGIDQPNEQGGIIRNLDSNRDIEIATASYGQGIAMTPIGATTALSTLANGGLMVRPHIVSKIDYLNGESKIINYDGIRIFKKDTTDDVTKMLVNLVDTALKNGQVKMDHYSIAAKTGTAQIANPATKGYYEDRYLHSFFGYFPAYNPRFIVFIYHLHPKNAGYASETLTDPFMQITKFLINYYELPPDR